MFWMKESWQAKPRTGLVTQRTPYTGLSEAGDLHTPTGSCCDWPAPPVRQPADITSHHRTSHQQADQAAPFLHSQIPSGRVRCLCRCDSGALPVPVRVRSAGSSPLQPLTLHSQAPGLLCRYRAVLFTIRLLRGRQALEAWPQPTRASHSGTDQVRAGKWPSVGNSVLRTYSCFEASVLKWNCSTSVH